MNKKQKLVQKAFLDDEEAVIRRLKTVYNQSLKDIEQKSKALQDQINGLQGFIDSTTDEASKAQLLSMQQSKIYQKQYQDALKKQIHIKVRYRTNREQSPDGLLFYNYI